MGKLLDGTLKGVRIMEGKGRCNGGYSLELDLPSFEEGGK